MPPRSGQLDQISEAIGELKGSVKAIEQYVHEGRHGTNNLSQKIDALAVKITTEVAAVEARLDSRLRALEASSNAQTGARTVLATLLQSPLLAWIFAAAVMAWTWVSTHGAHR